MIFGANSFFQDVSEPKSAELVVITGLILMTMGLLEIFVQNSLLSGIIKIVLGTVALITFMNA